VAYLGKADCATCEHEVDVRSNVSGYAYYRCGRCGHNGRETEERGNRLFVAKIRPEADPDNAPPEPGKSPRIAEPKPPAKPGESQQKPAPRRGLFGGVLGGE
jgi:hypothetical protein